MFKKYWTDGFFLIEFRKYANFTDTSILLSKQAGLNALLRQVSVIWNTVGHSILISRALVAGVSWEVLLKTRSSTRFKPSGWKVPQRVL